MTKCTFAALAVALALPAHANPLETIDILCSGPGAEERAGLEKEVRALELPPGEYRVDTWFNGHARRTTTIIASQRDRLVRVSLGFPEDRGNDALLVPISHDTQQAHRP